MIICTAASLSLTLTACQKNKVQTPSIKQDKDLKDHSIANRKKGKYTREGLILEGSGRIDCTQPGNNCKVSNKLADEDLSQLAILQQAIVTNGNGNSFFNTQGWNILFPEVADVPGLLTQIQNNQVFMYQLQSAQNSADPYGLSYVLSTAQSVSGVTNSNIQWIWQF